MTLAELCQMYPEANSEKASLCGWTENSLGKICLGYIGTVKDNLDKYSNEQAKFYGDDRNLVLLDNFYFSFGHLERNT